MFSVGDEVLFNGRRGKVVSQRQKNGIFTHIADRTRSWVFVKFTEEFRFAPHKEKIHCWYRNDSKKNSITVDRFRIADLILAPPKPKGTGGGRKISLDISELPDF